MRLLFDNNLAPRLVSDLAGVFPGSAHVRDLGMADADDEALWRVARSRDMCIVSKDDDFRQRATVRGHPPKVIVIRIGNCTTNAIRDHLVKNAAAIRAFIDDPEPAVLMLGA